MSRYAVEQDSPDGNAVYPECFGANAARGRELSRHDRLEDAVVECNSLSHCGMSCSSTWVWDLVRSTYVPRSGLKKLGARFTKNYPGK